MSQSLQTGSSTWKVADSPGRFSSHSTPPCSATIPWLENQPGESATFHVELPVWSD